MLRILSLIIAVIFTTCGLAQAAAPACALKTQGTDNQMYMPFPAALKHGVNLSRWWEDNQDYVLSADDIHAVHAMGLDFVRLPVSPSWLEMADSDQQTQKLGQLRCDIISLLNEGLTVVIDMHPSSDYATKLSQQPEEVAPHLERLWTKMQPVLAELPSWRIYLNLLNSPLVETTSWWPLQGKIIDDLRPVFPGNTFIASAGPFNGWWDLTDRVPYKDKNIVYGFDFYEPTFFTQHGAEWLQSTHQATPLSPIVYPVDKNFNFNMADPEVQKYVTQAWSRPALSVILRGIAAWRDHYNIGIVCLEFGVYRPHVDDRSRYNWLRDARESLDTFDIPWALWDYRGPFGILDTQGILDTGMISALNLRLVTTK